MFIERGRSAYNGERRPELERLRKRLPDADIVVVLRLDRLARSLTELLKLGGEFQQAGVQLASGLVRNSNPTGQLAQQLVATADPDYASWWAKTLRHGTLVGAHLTIDEIKARERVENIERAMSIGTTTAGGFLLPFTLDPTIQLTSNGAVNPIRQIARVERTTTNEWRGVTSAGGTASFDAEASEVSDDTPVLAQPVVQCDRATYFVLFSILKGILGRAHKAGQSIAVTTGGVRTTSSAESILEARGWPVPAITAPKAAKRKAEPEAKASMPKAEPKLRKRATRKPKVAPKAEPGAGLVRP